MRPQHNVRHLTRPRQYTCIQLARLLQRGRQGGRVTLVSSEPMTEGVDPPMADHDWVVAPVGIDAGRWVTRTDCRTILVAVHTMTTLHRLLDIVDLVEADSRVQIVFAPAPDVFNIGVGSHLRGIGALVIPWQQAIRERFDLAIAAAHGGLHELHAPVVLTAHGAGRARLIRAPGQGGRPLTRPSVYGLDAPRLIRDGRVVASALLLSHDQEKQVLLRQCPDAVPQAAVVGDPCFDRLMASLPQRRRYRRVLGVSDRQNLVIVSSTWGESGLFGSAPTLLPQLMRELPAENFRVAVLLHPAIWAAHGRRQVLAWTKESRAAGMTLVDPADDWRAYIAAADRLIGDRGSVSAYGAALGLPILRIRTTIEDLTATGSPQSLVLREAAPVDLDRAMLPQILGARPIDHRGLAAALTSRPGRSGQLIRDKLYQLIRLPNQQSSGGDWAFSAVSDPVARRAA